MRVLYLFNSPRSGLLRSFERGESPNDFLYGITYMKKLGIEADFYDSGFNRVLSKMLMPANKLMTKLTGSSFSFSQTLMLQSKMKKYDVILSNVDECGLSTALMKSLRLLRSSQVHVSMGLTDILRKVRSRTVLSFYRKLMMQPYKICTLSECESESFNSILGIPKDRLAHVPFGVDKDFFKPMKSGTEDFIMTMGHNLDRDYGTLMEAMRGSKFELKVVARPHNLRGMDIPSNVTPYYKFIPYTDLRDMLSRCSFVAITTNDMEYTPGQSATLGAMAMGKAVILTKTRGIFDRKLKDHKECIFVKPGDVNGLREKIDYLIDNPKEAEMIGKNARKLVEEKYNSENYARVLAGIIKSAEGAS